jgi:hypothetical protein
VRWSNNRASKGKSLLHCNDIDEIDAGKKAAANAAARFDWKWRG